VTPYRPKPDALALAALVVESLDELTCKPNQHWNYAVCGRCGDGLASKVPRSIRNALIWSITAKRSAAQKAGHRDCIGGRNGSLLRRHQREAARGWLDRRRPSPLQCAMSRGGGGVRNWRNGCAL